MVTASSSCIPFFVEEQSLNENVPFYGSRKGNIGMKQLFSTLKYTRYALSSMTAIVFGICMKGLGT